MVTAANVSYDRTIAPNASVTAGYQANHTRVSAAPSRFTLNGTARTTG
ncbi:cellulose binding domain-containing protein [Streptomyces sp. NPDC002144]